MVRKEKGQERSAARSIVGIAVASIALGLAVMILSVAILTGFKREVSQKVVGFGSHLSIVRHDTNNSFESQPINLRQHFYPSLADEPGILHIQPYATKAGIIKTDSTLQGIVLKGVGPDFDWDFFEGNLTEGQILDTQGERTEGILLSQQTADLLELKLGDAFAMYFIQDPPRARRFELVGIFRSGLEEYDRLYALVDIRHIQKLNDWTEEQVSGFEVLVEDFSQIEEVENRVRDLVAFNYEPGAEKLKVISIRESSSQIFDWLELSDTNVQVILVLMLLVAGINMISGLLILILENTRAIGLFKAMGATNWQVVKVFLFNAGFLVGKGLAWGNAIGLALALGQKRWSWVTLDPESYYVSAVPINLEITHLLLLNGGALLTILAMLLLPSLMVLKVSPAKAIAFE